MDLGLARTVFGCWLVLGGASFFACSSTEGSASGVPPFGGATPPVTPPAAVPSPVAPGGAAPDSDGASEVSEGQSAPSAAPSSPSAEVVGDEVAIDPGMMSTEGTSTGEDGESNEGDGAPADGSQLPSEGGDTPAPATPGPLQPVTVWIAGDSTVANGNTPCPRGWGGAFAPHFGDLVSVRNSAVGGRSVHTWLYEVQTVTDETGECALNRGANGEPLLQPRWQTMLDEMKAGDYLFIQFGINDSSATCDRHVGIEAFKAAYGMMAAEAKQRGAQPIFLTPVSSIACNGNTARGSRGGFVPATIEAGEEFDVPVIDLHARSVELFQARGFCPVAGGDVSAETTGAVGDFFCDDHTHFSSAGAIEISDVVVRALVEQQIPLAAYLR